jgi:hypothetical protein
MVEECELMMTALKCFVIMPYQPEFDPVFRAVSKSATDALPGQPVDCFWLKDVQSAGRITDDIVQGIEEAAFCIADVTGNNPNVMWETGYAMALGKPTMLIGRAVESLPFDLKVHRVLPYGMDALEALVTGLSEGIRQTLSRYEIGPRVISAVDHGDGTYSIAVTGSAHANERKVRRRAETLLQPYLGLDAMWYCGTSGTVDESVLAYLVENKQRAVAVGYHRYDITEPVRELVASGKVRFLDATVESVPRGLSGPTERDIFFSAKSDLVALFWDGKSRNTGRLVRYFEENAKSLLVGFV